MLADRIIFVCIIVFAGLYLYATSQIPALEIGDPLGPKAFPRLLGAGLFITAVMLLMEILRDRRAGAAQQEPAEKRAVERGHYMVIAAVVVWTGIYYAVFEHLGYMLATAIFLFVLMAYFHRNRWLTNGLTAVIFSVASYALFVKALGVTLAPGILSF
ncbi:MAG TPA: tripartite tricarboxylate transporter TctB family protein [Burkholderiales bacterium]|nr:tripartite tricarboxylate transporter TctB family protein [Burkholderiales bacterium]